MSTARINHIRGTNEVFEIAIVDENGNAFPEAQLLGAVVDFKLRTEPTALTDIIHWTSTANPTHLTLNHSTICLVFAPEDTAALTVAVYSFQVSVTLANDVVLPPIIEWSPFDLNLGGTSQPEPPVFTNTVKVDHNYGIEDALRYMTPGGSPIANAQVRVYYKSDYIAGRLSTPVGVTTTTNFGRWTAPILVLPGFTYTVQFFKPNEFGPDKAEIVA